MSTSNEDGPHDCAPVMWAYGILCPAMVSPNASPHKEDKLLHPDDHLIWCSKVDSGPHRLEKTREGRKVVPNSKMPNLAWDIAETQLTQEAQKGNNANITQLLQTLVTVIILIIAIVRQTITQIKKIAKKAVQAIEKQQNYRISPGTRKVNDEYDESYQSLTSMICNYCDN